MYLSTYYLEKLDLKISDLHNLSDQDKIQKICLQWMLLSANAENEADVETYTRAYHGLISPDNDAYNPIHRYYPETPAQVHVAAFSFAHREQIELSYQALIEEFSTLATEEDKQNFATRHREFIALATTIRNTRKEFEEFFAFYLQALFHKRLEPLSKSIIYKWRTAMIRLFGIEGLDDFQYRNAIASGQLMPILERTKLYSPIKLLVALMNSIILPIHISLNYVLNLHPALRFGFSILAFHPLVILLIQLPKIAQILEMIACPTNQIVRPLCAYSQLSASTVISLLSGASLVLAYGFMYTSLLAQLVSLLPYLQMLMFAYFLYSVGKLCVPFFQESFHAGLTFLVVFGLTFALLTSIRLYFANALNVSIIGMPKNSYQQWLTLLNLYSLVTLTRSHPEEPLTQMKSLPKPSLMIPAGMSEVIKTRYNQANLSALFFNTPKNATSIRPTEANPYSHCLAW